MKEIEATLDLNMDVSMTLTNGRKVPMPPLERAT